MATFTSYDAFAISTVGTQVGNGTARDYINLLWEHLGSVFYTNNPSSLDPTSQGVKYGWVNIEARRANTIPHLTQIVNISDISKGDVLIIDDLINGIAGFADENYNGTTIRMCLQNYSTASVTREDVDISRFLGGWRYDEWYIPPPPPPTPTTRGKSKFPWVLYARKLRRHML